MGWQNRNQPSCISMERSASTVLAGEPGWVASILGAPSEATLLKGSHFEWSTDLSSPLPSTGWILLVNNIFWHLSPLGKVCPQLLYRASREQLAHSAGTQWLLYEIRPKRHPVGRQRGHYQRVYLGILGKGQWVRTWCRGAGTGEQEEKDGR